MNIVTEGEKTTPIYEVWKGIVTEGYVRSTACDDVKRHTEDNSPKYRMVGEILSILRSFAVQTRIFAKECNMVGCNGLYKRSQQCKTTLWLVGY